MGEYVVTTRFIVVQEAVVSVPDDVDEEVAEGLALEAASYIDFFEQDAALALAPSGQIGMEYQVSHGDDDGEETVYDCTITDLTAEVEGCPDSQAEPGGV